MATITTELIESKRDDQGRRITSEAERAALLQGYRQSGLTQKAFAQQEGIKYSTFTSWLQGRRRAGAVAGPAQPTKFAEVPLLTDALLGGIEVRLPDGTMIRGTNAGQIAQVVRGLRT